MNSNQHLGKYLVFKTREYVITLLLFELNKTGLVFLKSFSKDWLNTHIHTLSLIDLEQ